MLVAGLADELVVEGGGGPVGQWEELGWWPQGKKAGPGANPPHRGWPVMVGER